jgi:hypothetical protein
MRRSWPPTDITAGAAHEIKARSNRPSPLIAGVVPSSAHRPRGRRPGGRKRLASDGSPAGLRAWRSRPPSRMQNRSAESGQYRNPVSRWRFGRRRSQNPLGLRQAGRDGCRFATRNPRASASTRVAARRGLTPLLYRSLSACAATAAPSCWARRARRRNGDAHGGLRDASYATADERSLFGSRHPHRDVGLASQQVFGPIRQRQLDDHAWMTGMELARIAGDTSAPTVSLAAIRTIV